MSAPHETLRPEGPAENSMLQPLLDQFEDAWARGGRPALDGYLPPGGPLRGPALRELAHLDLEYRLRSGEPARAEEYLRRYPELAADGAAAVSLLESERHWRRHLGQEPPSEVPTPGAGFRSDPSPPPPPPHM